MGRIESPGCGGSSSTPKIILESTGVHGQQKYKTLEGTTTEYDLLANGTTMALDVTATLTLPDARDP